MGAESTAIKIQINDLKTRYEASVHALEQEQAARLTKLQNEIAYSEELFEIQARSAINEIQEEIDKAPKEKRGPLELKLKKLKDSQSVSRIAFKNANRLKIEALKAQFKSEKDGLEETYNKNLRDLERRLAEAIKQEAEEEKKKKEEEERKKKEAEKELLITLTHFPKWWEDAQITRIHFTAIGAQTVVPASTKHNTFIASITFTVSGETNVSLLFGQFGSSGPMDFGGLGEPMAITMNFSDAPAPIGQGSFVISADGEDINIAGFAIFYRIPIKEKKK